MHLPKETGKLSYNSAVGVGEDVGLDETTHYLPHHPTNSRELKRANNQSVISSTNSREVQKEPLIFRSPLSIYVVDRIFGGFIGI